MVCRRGAAPAVAARQLPLLFLLLFLLCSSGSLLCNASDGGEDAPVTLSASGAGAVAGAEAAAAAAAAADGGAAAAPRLGSLFGWAIRNSDPSELAARGTEAEAAAASSLSEDGEETAARLARLKERAAELEEALSSSAGGGGSKGPSSLEAGLASALATAGDPSLSSRERASAWEEVAELSASSRGADVIV